MSFRLRVFWSDADRGAATRAPLRVLYRLRVSAAVLLGASLAVLVLPLHRTYVEDQATIAWLGRTPDWRSAAMGHEPVPPHIRARLHQAAQELPSSARAPLALAVAADRVSEPEAYTAGLTPAAVSLERAHARVGPSAELVPHLLRHYWSEIRLERPGTRVRSRALGRVRPTPRWVERMIALSREGSAAESRNAMYPAMHAAALLAAGRDAEGFAALRRVRGCTEWDDHALEEMDASRLLTLHALGDRGFWMHALPSRQLRFPHLAPLRFTAEIADRHARLAQARGEFRREHELRADVSHLGSLMHRRGTTLISRLVGRALVRYALGVGDMAPPPRLVGADWLEWQRQRDRQRREAVLAYLARVRRQAPGSAAVLEAAAADADTEPGAAGVFSRGLQFHEQVWSAQIYRDQLGVLFLQCLAVVAALWLAGAAAMTLGALFRTRYPNRVERIGVAPAGRACLWGLAAFAPLFLTGVQAVCLPTAALPPLLFRSVLLCAVVGLAAMRLRSGKERAWSAVHGGLLVLASVLGTAAALLFAQSPDQWVEWWRYGSSAGAPPAGAPIPPLVMLPMVAGVVGGTLVIALFRRASACSLLDGFIVGTRALAGTLVAGYILYLLVAVPLDRAAVRLLDRYQAAERRAEQLPVVAPARTPQSLP